MIIEKKKPIYIMSLEASDVYNHHHRGTGLKREYFGMIPFSLESIQLVKNNLKINYIEDKDKYISSDIINLNFKSKVKSAEDMLVILKKRMEYAQEKIQDINVNTKAYQRAFDSMMRLSSTIQEFEDNKSNWGEVAVEALRKDLYENGFSVTTYNHKTKKSKTVQYVVYKRSSAKSRTGQCLFIKKNMYKKMIDWSRMNLPFKKGQSVDLASLLAYESLVGSSLTDTININVKNILLVDDIDSRFKQEVNVVKKDDKTGFLNSFTEEEYVSNSLFDGESLLESKYFKNGKSMMLLRNHMFKSAAFSCNIQKFLRDQCPKDIEYRNWSIEDMYGNKILASDIEMITTPNSLKALKFSSVLPEKTDAAMWDYWREIVSKEGNLFGICKYEKESKLTKDSSDNTLQQTSYQMINCLPVNTQDIEDLLTTEKKYNKRMKEDNDFLIHEIRKGADITNSNEVFCNIYDINKNFENTRVFKRFKSNFISNKASYSKKGKIKIHGDYCVLLGNPLEFLYHAIGIDISDETFVPSLCYNQVHCNMFDTGEKLIGFRNPNTSPSNVLIMENKIIDDINKYFNLSDNIIVVNAIKFAIQDILSGCDYDSDTMLVSNEKKLVEIGERCFGQYRVCLNKIQGKKHDYKLDNNSHYEIDNQLSQSQKLIGRVVNLGQYCMSIYWDAINKNISPKDVEDLLKSVDVMTILSGIAIDMAKKFYDMDIPSEIKQVEKNKMVSEREKKPNFWVYVSQNKSIKDKVEHFDCPMDFLISSIKKFDSSDRTKSIEFSSILKDYDQKEVDKRQMKKIEALIEDHINRTKSMWHENKIKQENKEEFRESLDELEIGLANKLKTWSINKETMSSIVCKSIEEDNGLGIKTMKILFDYNKEEFLKIFKKA